MADYMTDLINSINAREAAKAAKDRPVKRNREDNGQYRKYNRCMACGVKMPEGEGEFHSDYCSDESHANPKFNDELICDTCLWTVCGKEDFKPQA